MPKQLDKDEIKMKKKYYLILSLSTLTDHLNLLMRGSADFTSKGHTQSVAIIYLQIVKPTLHFLIIQFQ